MDFIIITTIILRLVVPLLILRFPLLGLGASAILDYVDYNIYGTQTYYQSLDKILDLYYLSLCLAVALKWRDRLAKKVLIGLFAYRAIGVLLLTLTGAEWILVIFPNVIEVFFVFYIIYERFNNTRMIRSRRDGLLIGISLLIPKLFQEYSLHVQPYYPESARGLFGWIIELPLPVSIILWLILPLSALVLTSVNRQQKVAWHPPWRHAT